jgi:hypothetical protein
VAQPEFVALGIPVCSRTCARWLSKKVNSRPELARKVKQYSEEVQELQEGRQRVTPEVTKALREKVPVVMVTNYKLLSDLLVMLLVGVTSPKGPLHLIKLTNLLLLILSLPLPAIFM